MKRYAILHDPVLERQRNQRHLPKLRNTFDAIKAASYCLRSRPIFWSLPLAFDGEQFWHWTGQHEDGAKGGHWERVSVTRMKQQWIPAALETLRIRWTRANRDELMDAVQSLCYVPDNLMGRRRIETDDDRVRYEPVMPDPWTIKRGYFLWQGAIVWRIEPETDSTDDQPQEAAS
jgi:hypothetical protein